MSEQNQQQEEQVNEKRNLSAKDREKLSKHFEGQTVKTDDGRSLEFKTVEVGQFDGESIVDFRAIRKPDENTVYLGDREVEDDWDDESYVFSLVHGDGETPGFVDLLTLFSTNNMPESDLPSDRDLREYFNEYKKQYLNALIISRHPNIDINKGIKIYLEAALRKIKNRKQEIATIDVARGDIDNRAGQNAKALLDKCAHAIRSFLDENRGKF